jgi:TPP-dependent pyruvate/acetoin dehydrogenase alpha subunit
MATHRAHPTEIGQRALPGALREESAMQPERIEQLLHYYKDMLRIRYFEEKILNYMLPNKLFRGSSHLCIGQEAVAVGAIHAMEAEDYLYTTHRSHGHTLARGMDMEAAFAEIMGRTTGVCHGRGGSMHLADASLRILGANPVVGSNIPMAAGSALALKMQGKPGIVVAFFGEGALNTGACHEAFNMAALWDLPVVFICEDNQYAISVPEATAMADEDLHERAAAYGMEGLRLDGMNVLEVYEFCRATFGKTRRTGRPALLVFDTYRFVGHHTADSEQYRPKDEAIEVLREKDPVHFVEREFLEDCLVDPEKAVDIRLEIKEEVEAAFQRALNGPWPDPEKLTEGLWAESEVTCDE